MNLPIKLLGSLAVAGMVAAGGTAFTASGVVRTAVAADQAVNVGTVDQTVSGATMNSVVYHTTGNNVTSITATFAGPLLITDTVKLAAFTGAAFTATADATLAPTEAGTAVAVFNFTLSGGGYADLSKIIITVNNA